MLQGNCEGGHLEIIKWLATHFNLSPKDARAGDNYALHSSCLNGHLEVAKWLVTHFKLSPKDIRSFALIALPPDIARWLSSHFNLPAHIW